MRLLILLLLAAPLSAQEPQTVVVPNVLNEITVGPTPVEIFVQPAMSDSAMIANLAENNRLLREMLVQERECCGGGGSTVVRIGQGALVLIAAFMAWQVKKIADKPNGDTDVDVDVDVENTIPPHEHERKKREH